MKLFSFLVKSLRKPADPFHLQRFIDAQEHTYHYALDEIQNGRKEGHWIWYIFPQMKGLGQSYMSENYGIVSLDEARAYLAHPILRSRLIEITQTLLQHKDKTAYEIFGTIDAIKVRSCMTLFDVVEPNSIFADTLATFYDNERDELTLNKLKTMNNEVNRALVAKKPSFKTTTLIAAIATTLFMIISRLLVSLDISVFGGNPILWVHKSTPLYWLCIVSYILMYATFYRSKLELTGVSVVSRIISGVFIVIFAFLSIEHLTHYCLNPRFSHDYEAYRIVYYYILRYSVLIVLWGMYVFYDKLGIQVCLIKQTRKFRKNVLALAVIMSVALVLDVVATSIDVATSDSWIQYGGPKYGDWSFISGILQNLLRCTIYITFICLFRKILFFKRYVNPEYSVSITTSSISAGGKDHK